MTLRPVLGQFNPVSTFTTFYFRFILMLSSFILRVVSSLLTFRLKHLCQFLLSPRFLPCQLNIAVKSIALLFVIGRSRSEAATQKPFIPTRYSWFYSIFPIKCRQRNSRLNHFLLHTPKFIIYESCYLAPYNLQY
jgi:hypothetical protein